MSHFLFHSIVFIIGFEGGASRCHGTSRAVNVKK